MNAVGSHTQPASAPNTRRFEVRHSPLGRIAVAAAPIAELAIFGILVTVGGISPESAVVLLAVLWSLSLGHAWLLLGSRYELTSTTLRIVHGPLRQEVALTDILRARAIRTLDRGPVVEANIAYGKRLVLSPVEREALVQALQPTVSDRFDPTKPLPQHSGTV